MSFGEGNLHDEIDRLKEVNGKLCAEINRQERVIEQLRDKEAAYMDANHEQGMQLIEQGKRVRELESLVRDMHNLLATPAWDRGGWSTDGRCVDFDVRMVELGIEVDE